MNRLSKGLSALFEEEKTVYENHSNEYETTPDVVFAKGFVEHVNGNKKRTTVYYCHPYRSSERGTNERLNREIRRKIPKGSDIAAYSDEDISSVETWLNNYPRGCLNFKTPNALFNAHVAAIKENRPL